MEDLIRDLNEKIIKYKSETDSVDELVDDNKSLFDESISSRSGQRIDEVSAEALQLINEIRNRKPPKIEIKNTIRVSPFQINVENKRRNRIPDVKPMLNNNRQPISMADLKDSVVAPSVKVDPLPIMINDIPTFQEVMEELGMPKLIDRENKSQPLYMVDCRILSEKLLKNLITKRAEIFLKKLESGRVDRGTQTFVSTTGKQRSAACVTCKSRDHHFIDCKLPMRPGICLICGAEGFETKDCVYPHGIEHELALNKCVGCSNDLSIYCPECPDCNVRYAGLVDWLRLNYATWPTWAIPLDHRYLVNEHEFGELRRTFKANFSNKNDYPNRVRSFLIRETSLSATDRPANRTEPFKNKLSEEKRLLSDRSLTTRFADLTLDEVMALRP